MEKPSNLEIGEDLLPTPSSSDELAYYLGLLVDSYEQKTGALVHEVLLAREWERGNNPITLEETAELSPVQNVVLNVRHPAV